MYIEPFAGSLAMLLGRPHQPRHEVVNDYDAYLSNFWRAVKWHPKETAEWADWPVSEADLFSRHQWLREQQPFRDKMRSDPEYCDPKIAGWWVWGISQWLGAGWCEQGGSEKNQIPLLTGRNGVHSATSDQKPFLHHKRGIETATSDRIPNVSYKGGRGLTRRNVSEKIPRVASSGAGEVVGRSFSPNSRGTDIYAWFRRLQSRLRDVRVCCGDWSRVLSDAVTDPQGGYCAVFLDPPYKDADHDMHYAAGTGDIWDDVKRWAIENGGRKNMRIALCGYEPEVFPSSWTKVNWEASGGYGNINNSSEENENAARECIWFSPNCKKP